MSGSAKIETYTDAKLPDLNPYEMFPPSFHELLDIPIHVYRNGTTYNPHDKYKHTKFNPVITKGYANTNVNGNAKISKNKVVNRMKPKRVINRIKPSGLNPVDYFESKKISENDNTDETINVKLHPSTKPSLQFNKQTIKEKKISGSRDSNDGILDKESETFSFQDRRKTKLRPIRPSLRFRSTSPPTVTRNYYTTESSEVKKPMTTTSLPVPAPETSDNFDSSYISEDHMSPPVSSIHTTFESSGRERPTQKFDKDHVSFTVSDIRNTFEDTEREKPLEQLENDHMSHPMSNIRTSFESTKRERPIQQFNEDYETSPELNIHTTYENSERERPVEQFEPLPVDEPEEMPEDLNPTLRFDINEKDERRKNNFVPSHFEGSRTESNDYESEHEPSQNFKFPDKDNFLKFDIKDKIRKQIPVTDKEKDVYPFIEESRFEEKPNFFEQSFKEPKLQKKKPSKFNFKPSVLNQYPIESTFTQFSNKKTDPEKIILPTTFRPLHSFSMGREASISTTFKPPSNVFLNEPSIERGSSFKPPQEIQENLYDSSVFNGNLPFTNSHSIIKPFRRYTIQSSSQERREPQLERGVPVYISSPIRNSVQLIQREFERFSQHPGLSADLRPPPTQEHQEKSFNDRLSYDFNPSARIYSEFDNDRERNSNNNNKPSFFEKLGFFRAKPKQVNRNGLSPSKSSVFEPIEKKPHTIEYVLSNGPAPVNAKKVVVVGPFKEPPIGAPVFLPESENQRDGSEGLFQVPAPALNSVRKAKANEDKLYQEITEFHEPRYFRFGNNNIFDKNESRDIVVQSQFEVGDQSQIDANSYRQGSVSSVNRFSSSGFSNEPKRAPNFHNNNLQESKPVVRSGIQVRNRNYNQFDEVSEEDKNRLIAAKFQIPRISSIRRSGLQRHIIPIPVPLMTSSGEQILGFQNIQVPNSPVVKKTGRLLDTDLYNNIEISHSESKKNSGPLTKQKLEGKSKGEKTNAKASPSTVIKTAHEAGAFDKIINVGPPQSYREPSVSDITFGGWHAVGDSPVKSYVKESSPFVFIKTFEDQIDNENNPEEIVITEIVEVEDEE
ncbi:hypothetical protein Anas_10449 [Armadillidium nasatum]|uniref:Uncharacterized protein n=1 Tax=Armadillidium nasatum TaxID=96803 RepID=A0A5N5TP53_9CRUS|nr:hypothetical protein Anas_10449 [Armadillidium nasatum]